MECRGHSHDHEHADDAGHSLHDAIDKPHVWCLNEEIRDSGRNILKSYEERFARYPSLCSQEAIDEDEDPELLLYVPFSEAVSIKSLSIRGVKDSGENNSHREQRTQDPKTVKLFVDRDDLDFETAREIRPEMTLDLLPPDHDDGTGTVDYPIRPSGRFQNISSITLYFFDNYGEPDECCQTEITFVGFKGKGSRMRRRAVQCVYESRGMMKDHKVPDDAMGSTSNSLM